MSLILSIISFRKFSFDWKMTKFKNILERNWTKISWLAMGCFSEGLLLIKFVVRGRWLGMEKVKNVLVLKLDLQVLSETSRSIQWLVFLWYYKYTEPWSYLYSTNADRVYYPKDFVPNSFSFLSCTVTVHSIFLRSQKSFVRYNSLLVNAKVHEFIDVQQALT